MEGWKAEAGSGIFDFFSNSVFFMEIVCITKQALRSEILQVSELPVTFLVIFHYSCLAEKCYDHWMQTVG